MAKRPKVAEKHILMGLQMTMSNPKMENKMKKMKKTKVYYVAYQLTRNEAKTVSWQSQWVAHVRPSPLVPRPPAV